MQMVFVAPSDTPRIYAQAYGPRMGKHHYIKEWIEHRGLSYRRLAQRMEREPGEELISFASVGRIANEKQPYTEETLEALAQALDAEPWQLINVNPLVEGDVIDLMGYYRSLTPDQKAQAMKVLKALTG